MLDKKVEIEWVDAFELESGWHTIQEASKMTPPTIDSLGYVVKETKEYIIICADKGRVGDSDCGRVQLIPRSWVKKVNIL
jgi:hypothetical protein